MGGISHSFPTLATLRGERVKGIEPSYAAWEAAVLPLNYTRENYWRHLPHFTNLTARKPRHRQALARKVRCLCCL